MERSLFFDDSNPTTTVSTPSFRRKPESSRSDSEDGYFDSMVIGELLDAGSVIPDLIRDRHDSI